MKCYHCGFTYDDEAVCPICGTPAPREEKTAEPASYYYPVHQAPVQRPPVRHTPAHMRPDPEPEPKCIEKKPEEPKESALSRQSRGLRIATLCVLSVIAFALVLGTMLQAALLIQNKHTAVTGTARSDEAASLPKDWSDEVLADQQSFVDSATHKIGESFDFGKGTVTLKSAAVSKAKSTFNDKLRQVAFTLQIVNNTKETQVYEAPNMRLSSDGYDAEHFAFAEYSVSTDEAYASIEPGKAYTAVYYYNLPNEKTTVTASVCAFGDNGGYTAVTTYTFSLGDIK